MDESFLGINLYREKGKTECSILGANSSKRRERRKRWNNRKIKQHLRSSKHQSSRSRREFLEEWLKHHINTFLYNGKIKTSLPTFHDCEGKRETEKKRKTALFVRVRISYNPDVF